MGSLEEQFRHMATGAMYNDLSAELLAAREAAVLATNTYNASYGRPAAERDALLRQVLGSVGEGASFEPTFRCEFGRNIHVGDRFYANFDCVMLDGAPITIGSDVLMGPKVGLYTSNHALEVRERAAGACWAAPIVIGDGVWVAGGVSILPGVTIGDGAVIGAGAVVTKDMPAYTVAAGNPARVIRDITAADRTDLQKH